MVNDIFTWLNSLVSGNSGYALAGSFLWGIFSILLSPCHLSTIPLVIAFVSNSGSNVKNAFYISFIFTMGVLITIAAIGLVTASTGRILGDIGSAANYIIPAVLLISGLLLLDIIKINSVGLNTANRTGKGLAKIFVLGVIIGIGLGPCTFAFMAPVLGVVFSSASGNLMFSVLLLLMFALGHGAVIITAGTFSKKVQVYLKWNESSKAILIIKKVLGVLAFLSSAYLFAEAF